MDEPPPPSGFVLRRAALGVEVDQLERILELASSGARARVLGHPQGPALDRAAEADVGVSFPRSRTYVLTTRPPVRIQGVVERDEDPVITSSASPEDELVRMYACSVTTTRLSPGRWQSEARSAA